MISRERERLIGEATRLAGHGDRDVCWTSISLSLAVLASVAHEALQHLIEEGLDSPGKTACEEAVICEEAAMILQLDRGD